MSVWIVQIVSLNGGRTYSTGADTGDDSDRFGRHWDRVRLELEDRIVAMVNFSYYSVNEGGDTYRG